MADGYTVQNEGPGCGSCGEGATWNVVGPDGVATGTIYGDYDNAQEMARDLSRAYANGRNAAFAIVTRRTGPEDRRDRSKDWFKPGSDERRKSPGNRVTDDDLPF